MREQSWYNPSSVSLLKSGSVVCGPTDTVYGLLASTDHQQAIDRIYEIKQRDRTKSLIVLISNTKELKNFGVSDTDVARAELYWPAKTSLIINTPNAPRYLTRGKPNLAFRMPDSNMLRKLIFKTGPLVAPSANPEGQIPALSKTQAKNYFGKKVDCYVGSNKVVANSSSVILDLSQQSVRQVR